MITLRVACVTRACCCRPLPARSPHRSFTALAGGASSAVVEGLVATESLVDARAAARKLGMELVERPIRATDERTLIFLWTPRAVPSPTER
jgi:hypothetical protein